MAGRWARESFYVMAQREWPDGMRLSGAAEIDYTRCDDDTIIMHVTVIDGERATFILDSDVLVPLEMVHEFIFQGSAALLVT